VHKKISTEFHTYELCIILQYGVFLLVPVLLSGGIIQQILPLHDSEDLSYLRDNWVQAFFHTQPLGV